MSNMRHYALVADDYTDGIYMLRRLRKRKVKLDYIIVVVEVDHWNKVKDFISKDKDRDFDIRGRPTIVVIR